MSPQSGSHNPPPTRLQSGAASLRGIFYWAAVLFWLSLSWFFLKIIYVQENLLARWLFIALLSGCMAVLAIFSLNQTGLSHKWSHRLGFLSSLFILILLSLVTTFSSHLQRTSDGIHLLIALTAACSGAFAGSLITTRQETGLWEDNAPPPPAVTSEVELIHQSITGQPDRTPASKRIFDLLLSIFGLVLSAPIWIASAFLVWFEDPGPILFVKNSVGKGGGNFRQYKFRSMVHQAEQSTGPVLATQDDERVLWIGRLLRKTALDELPQLLNILNGQMSFVGPRPQRTVLVQGYLQDLPVYAERHRVQPGLAGLAQVAGDYYLTPLQKLRFDRLYIQHLSLGYDLKLLTLAFLITFWYRWQKDWDGRLPRRLLHPPLSAARQTSESAPQSKH